MMRLVSVFAAFVALAVGAPAAVAKPPLEAFGDVPRIKLMELSPDGKKIAYLQRMDGDETLVIYDLITKRKKGLTRVGSLRARALQFVGADRVVIVASKDTRTFGFRGRYESSAAFAFDISVGKPVQLLLGTRDNFPAQSGLGQLVGVAPGGREIFMPAFMNGRSCDADYNLLRVLLDNGRGVQAEGGRGSDNTIDWLVDSNGKVVVREDFNEHLTEHSLRVKQPGGDCTVTYRNKTPLPAIGIVNLSEDAASIYAIDSGDSEFYSLYKMGVTGGAM